MLLWLLIHWKWVAALAAIALVVASVTTPAVARLLWRRRVGVAVVALLLATHGGVAAATKAFFTDQAERARLQRQRDEARLRVTVLEADAEAAEAMRVRLAELEKRGQEAEDALVDSDRVCFAGPDADRLRQLFD